MIKSYLIFSFNSFLSSSSKTYIMNHDDVRFFCNGYYAEIIIMDGLTLQLLFTLNSKLNPDWISAIHVLRPTRSQGIGIRFFLFISLPLFLNF